MQLLSGSGQTAAPSAASAGAMSAPLPQLDLAGINLWDWDKAWHASQWANASSTIPWRADYMANRADGSVVFNLDRNGAAQLQAVNGTPAQASGLWEVDATAIARRPDRRAAVAVKFPNPR